MKIVTGASILLYTLCVGYVIYKFYQDIRK
jgi:hypothetical protein